MHKEDIVLLKDGYWDGYDQHLNPSAANGFTIAFRYYAKRCQIHTDSFLGRFGHTLLPSTVERWTKNHR